jgi:hypothetical protein
MFALAFVPSPFGESQSPTPSSIQKSSLSGYSTAARIMRASSLRNSLRQLRFDFSLTIPCRSRERPLVATPRMSACWNDTPGDERPLGDVLSKASDVRHCHLRPSGGSA